jgi:hypothetical protein
MFLEAGWKRWQPLQADLNFRQFFGNWSNWQLGTGGSRVQLETREGNLLLGACGTKGQLGAGGSSW